MITNYSFPFSEKKETIYFLMVVKKWDNFVTHIFLFNDLILESLIFSLNFDLDFLFIVFFLFFLFITTFDTSIFFVTNN